MIQVLRELEEEELMEQCLVAMLDDEESQGNGTATTNNARNTNETSNSSSSMNGLSDSVTNMSLSANGVRSNPPSDDSSNSHSNSRSRFSVQDRLLVSSLTKLTSRLYEFYLLIFLFQTNE